ncbi:hypothetical protein Swit_0072 [Rhizorhabdus wittichii RW1]|uniref:Uncharacterized protein n=1 Tax=Rhizorhabdus wittichii (strain DSM 6014 / CCUG 31198 / JCM 15750 / NBRC 105917 / EY 4224 / RW1) TaxID=392499 RepID=A0A9J9H7M4_RHIWR|nr:hypothetical protein Swit_0072 [Rhizorhabdus wittichii RW1]
MGDAPQARGGLIGGARPASALLGRVGGGAPLLYQQALALGRLAMDAGQHQMGLPRLRAAGFRRGLLLLRGPLLEIDDVFLAHRSDSSLARQRHGGRRPTRWRAGSVLLIAGKSAV